MTFSDLWNNYINLEPGAGQILLRLLCAMAVGLVIGMERELTHRPAGLRTHILVALGACVVSVTGQMLFTQYAALGASPDPARLSAQVITGVGFLGAGTIMKEGVNVRGLTTAASVWAVACLGIAAGFGYYILAIGGMILILITLTAFEALQHKLLDAVASEDHYILDTDDVSASLLRLSSVAQTHRITIYDLSAEQTSTGHRITFRAWFSGRHYKVHHKRFFEDIAGAPETKKIRRTNKSAAAV